MNKVTLVGRMAKDPELKQTSTGNAVGNFAVAVDRRFKRDGQPAADFFNVVAWNKPAELINQYLHKGDRIALNGRLQTRSYDAKDGTRKYITEIILEEFDFIGSKNDHQQVPKPQAKPNYQDNFGENFNMMVEDDSLPF